LARAIEAQVISAGLVKSWESGDWGEVAGSAEAGVEAAAVAQGASTMGTWTDPANGDGYCLVAVDLESGVDPCAAVLETAGTDCRADAGESAGGAGKGAMIQRPTWVNSPPTAKGAVVATGVGRRSAYRANLLEAGVRDGMAGLVRILGVKVGGLLEKLEHGNGGPSSEERVLSATGRLAGARLLAWWVDPSSGDAFTLVCMPAAGVKVRLGKELLERADGVGGAAAPEATETPEQLHERKREELRRMLDDTL